MVAIFTGSGLGLGRSSASVLGGAGVLGSAVTGRGGEGVYVNAATGNLVVNQRDEFLVGLGPDSAFNRTYNSLGLADDDNGDKWATFGSAIVGSSSGVYVDRRDWDGDVVRYYYDAASGAYVSKESGGAYDKLSLSGGNWTWKDGDSGVTESYSSSYNNRVVAKADRDGNTITYGYASATGNLTRLTTADGDSVKNFTEIGWSGNNMTSLVTTYADPQGATKTLTRTRYGYDGSNRLTTVTVDLSPEDNSISDGRVYVTSYTYDGNSKRVATISQTDGTLLSFSYDSSGRVQTFTQTVDGSATRTTTFAYYPVAGWTTITDPQGNLTALQYDSAGQLIKKIEPAPVSGGNAITTTFAYNGNGDVIRIRRYDGLDNGTLIPANYSASSNLNGYTGLSGTGAGMRDGIYNNYSSVHGNANAAGSYIMMDLGFATQVDSVTLAAAATDTWGAVFVNGGTIQRSSDGTNWTTVTTISGVVDGVPSTFTVNATARYLRIVTNGSNWLALGDFYATGPATPISEENFGYDANGNLLEHVDATARTTKWTYGSNNEALTKTVYTGIDPDGLGGSLPSGAMTTRYVYDGEVHLKYAVTAEGRVSRNQYNADGTLQAHVDYNTVSYTGATATETDLDNWLNAITDKSNIGERTDFTYDLRGNVLTATTYAKTDPAGSGVTTADYSRITYVYDQAGNLLSKLSSESGAVAETYAYDGMGRVVRFTDAKGVGTWTSFIDAKSRTVTTLASGLTTTSVYNRAGELISSSETRTSLSEITAFADIGQWGTYTGLLPSAGTVDGAPARQTLANDSIAFSPTFAVTGGRTYTLVISLMAVGGTSSASIGFIGSADYWGTDNSSSARIISGPGSLDQEQGSFFNFSGLSTTEATRIEITRYYDQTPSSGNGQIWIYPDRPNGSRSGFGVKIAAAAMYESAYEGNFSSILADVNNWAAGGLTATSAGTIDGGPAKKYTASGGWAAIYATAIDGGGNLWGTAGDTFTYTGSYMAVAGSANQVVIAPWADGTYGSADDSVGRVISGPGTLVQLSNGAWQLSGLSTTQATRVEIQRTVRTATGLTIYNYVDTPGNAAAGQQLIFAAPSLTRTPGAITSYKYDSLGRLRIKQDPLGARTFYFYDKRSRKIGEVDGAGSVTEYKYDAADNLIATVAYATALTSTQIASLFDSYYGTPTSVDFPAIRPATNAADRWGWVTYDKEGRPSVAADAAGAVTAFEYDGAGRITKTTNFSNPLSSGTLSSYVSAPPTTIALPAVDATNDRVSRNFYDNDGLLVGTLDADGYLTQINYDKAGRKTGTVKLANVTPSSLWAAGTFAQLWGSTSFNANDIYGYWIYDGRGLLAATIDGEGDVTRYHYTARGDVDQEIRGQKVTASTSYTFATLPTASGTLEVTTYTRDVRGQVLTRARALSGGQTETTTYTYDRMGNVLSETVAETVSSETRTSTFRYDAKGRLVGSLAGNGSAALATLGANPTRTQIDTIYATYGTRFVYDPEGKLIAKITPDGTGAVGLKTLYYYDGDDRLRFQIDALGEVVETRYNALGDQNETVVYGTRIASGTLATLKGGPVDTTLTNAVAAIADAAKDSKTSALFDGRGLASQLNDALSNTTTRGYSTFGELISETLAVGGPGGTQSTTYGYSRRGQRKLEIEASIFGVSAGQWSHGTTFDFAGRAKVYANNSDGRQTTIGYRGMASPQSPGRNPKFGDAFAMRTMGYDYRRDFGFSIQPASAQYFGEPVFGPIISAGKGVYDWVTGGGLSDTVIATWNDVGELVAPAEQEILVVGEKIRRKVVDWADNTALPAVRQAGAMAQQWAIQQVMTSKPFITTILASCAADKLGFHQAAGMLRGQGGIMIGFAERPAQIVTGVTGGAITLAAHPLVTSKAVLSRFADGVDAVFMASTDDAINYARRSITAENALATRAFNGDMSAGRQIGHQAFDVASVLVPVAGELSATRVGVGGVAAESEVLTVANPRNLRPIQGPAEMTGSKIKRFTSDMRANGYDPAFPVDVANVGDRMIIIDGHHRTAAAIKAGIGEIPVRIVPVSPERATQLGIDAADAAAQRALRGR